MSAKCVVFIATSLDGFIARDDGRIDWLEQANQAVPIGEDCGYSQFMANVDVIVMGRNTFEQVLAFDTWPYGTTPVVVLSHRGINLATAPDSVSVSQEQPAALVTRLSKLGANKIYVDGGLTIQSFLAAGLINEITITVIPILLGSGKALFGRLANDIQLSHQTTTAFEFGFVQITYQVSPIKATSSKSGL